MTERNYIALAADYQAGVLDGSIPVCHWVRQACVRNRKDCDRQGSDGFPYHFSPEHAVRICQMAEMLPHIKGPKAKIIGRDDKDRAIWNPIQLEPWQCWILTTVFGWVNAEGKRRFRTAFTLIPRKNAKSTLAAVVTLFMLVADNESGAECYSAATSRDQAKVIAEILWEMAKRSPAFCEFYGVRIGSETTKTLAVPATGSKFSPLSAEANTLDGLNVSFAAIDEFHAHKTRAVYDVIDTATGTREQPLLFPITTAGVDIGGVCHEKLQYLEKILDDVVQDETFFGINYTTDPDDDWADVAVHQKANPNYGISVQPDDLARKVQAAKHSPSAINNFLTKHLNVWVKAEAAWIQMDAWHACGQKSLKLEDFAGTRVPCWIGVDLAECKDIAAVVLLFQPQPRKYVVFARCYLPEETIDRSPVAQYPGWVRDGYLLAVEGNTIDYQQIEDDIVGLTERFHVRQIDFDRALAAYMLQSLLKRFERKLGREGAAQFVVQVPQSIQDMNPAMQELERAVLSKSLSHPCNPVLTWAMSNVVIQRNYKDELYPRKAGGKDSVNKIDPIVALLTAMSQAMHAQPERVRPGAFAV